MSGSGNDGGADPGYAEYPLIAAPSLGYHHHILRLVPSSSTAQAEENLVADWARPLKLNRKDWWSIRKKADEERKAVKRQQQEQQKAEAEADDEDIKDVKMQDVESSDPLAAAAPPKAARDESLIAPGPTGTPSRAKPAGGGGGRFKKKTKQIHIAADQAARILRRQENRPWLLEDSGPPGHSQRWIGEFEAAHDAGGTSATASASAVKTDSPLGVGSGEYVVFRLAGPPAGGEDGRNAFEVVPIGRTYRFTPRPTYDTLTADEAAEAYEKMQKVGTRDDFGRWFMRRRNPGAANGAAGGMLKREGSAGRDQVSASVVNGRRFRAVDQSGIRERDDLFDDDDGGEEDVKPRIRRGRSAGAGGEGEFDEFDFDEEFADDEEGAGNLNDEAMEEDELREIEVTFRHLIFRSYGWTERSSSAGTTQAGDADGRPSRRRRTHVRRSRSRRRRHPASGREQDGRRRGRGPESGGTSDEEVVEEEEGSGVGERRRGAEPVCFPGASLVLIKSAQAMGLISYPPRTGRRLGRRVFRLVA